MDNFPLIFELTEKRLIARDVLACVLRVVNKQRFAFQAGQHIILQIPMPHPETFADRAFSIASHPQKIETLDIIVKLNTNGVASNFFRAAQIGTRIFGSGPNGDFVVRSIGQPIVLIAAGAGVAPLYAMIHSILGSGSLLPLHLLFYKEEEGYVELVADLAELAERHFNFHFNVITDQKVSTELLCAEEYLNTPAFYLCGGGQFVGDLKQQLICAGFSEEIIYHE